MAPPIVIVFILLLLLAKPETQIGIGLAIGHFSQCKKLLSQRAIFTIPYLLQSFSLLRIFEMTETAPLLPVTLTCSTDLRFIDLIQVVGGELLKHMSFSTDDSEMIWLAIQEGIANAMRHGNKLDTSKTVSVKFVPGYEQFEIHITDQGDGYDMESIPNPNLPENLLKPSGRGVFFIREVMDSVETKCSESGNTLILIKRRKGHS
jgi:serine/threonine-protein kinase RsbW